MDNFESTLKEILEQNINNKLTLQLARGLFADVMEKHNEVIEELKPETKSNRNK